MEERSNTDYVYLGSMVIRRRNVNTVEVDKTVTLIKDRAFENWTSLRYIRIPDTVTFIGEYAFMLCKSLITVTLPPTITTISDCVFMQCRSLKSVILPPTINTISDRVFLGCHSLTSITLPPNITKIGNLAFYGCSSLTTVALPPAINTIGDLAFSGCSALTSVHLPENLFAVSYRAFDRCSKLFTITSSAFSTTTLDKSPNGFKKFLVDAGFHPEKPTCILRGPSRPTWPEMYYEWKTWARMIDADGRLPLFSAAVRSLNWNYMEKIFIAHMPLIQETDVQSGLPAFMLAAIGPASDIESVYNLLKEYPPASHMYGNVSTDRTRKRGGRKFAQDKMPKL